MEPLYRGHIGTLETVEVVLNSEVEPLYKGHIGTFFFIEVVLNQKQY